MISIHCSCCTDSVFLFLGYIEASEITIVVTTVYVFSTTLIQYYMICVGVLIFNFSVVKYIKCTPLVVMDELCGCLGKSPTASGQLEATRWVMQVFSALLFVTLVIMYFSLSCLFLSLSRCLPSFLLSPCMCGSLGSYLFKSSTLSIAMLSGTCFLSQLLSILDWLGCAIELYTSCNNNKV